MAPASLRIRLLGGLDLRQGRAALPPLPGRPGPSRCWRSCCSIRRRRSLRQHLAFLLWPDSSEGKRESPPPAARPAARLPEADQFLGDAADAPVAAGAPCWLDVAAFDAALARSERGPGGSAAALAEAVELYAGDLLQGSYDEWLGDERERLRQRYLQALERLVELLEARGDLAAATGRAERLLREDPLREPRPYQVLMRLHDARGTGRGPCASTTPARPPWPASSASSRRRRPAGPMRPCCPPGPSRPPTSRARPGRPGPRR